MAIELNGVELTRCRGAVVLSHHRPVGKATEQLEKNPYGLPCRLFLHGHEHGGAQRTGDPRVAMVDIQLSDGDSGYALGRRLKQAVPNIVLVAHTGYAMSYVRQQAQDAEFDIYLSKPASPATLLLLLSQPTSPALACREIESLK